MKNLCIRQYNILNISLFFTNFQWVCISQEKGLDIDKTKNILNNLKIEIEKNRSAFSNYNMVRMREAIRYLTKEKLEIFIKIPFLLHINSPEFPGFMDSRVSPHGIWNFENSGFYKVAVKTKIFPKSIIETAGVNSPAILGLYHIGSLGTFTQSMGSDFDYWIIIDKKKFSKKRYKSLEQKLNALVRYSREEYHQKVTFFVMDQKKIKHNSYAPFKDEETLTAPKIFLKEEFYRTYLMIAGKIPAWSVLPGLEDSQIKEETGMSMDGITSQILSMYDDLIDLGLIKFIPMEDILKGLLWHICKSRSDPVKAVIKATMIFSYGYSGLGSQVLLCELIKKGYSKAGIDDYDADPYKSLFDRILEFQEIQDSKGINLIKNAIFFRLCGYPDVKMPNKNTPKHRLLEKYIRSWNLNKNQVGKLLSYSTWSEPEKLLLEKTFVNQLFQMYNHVIQKTNKIKSVVDRKQEKRNWKLLKNKTRERLRENPNKIAECSTYLRRRNIINLNIIKKSNSWELTIQTKSGQRINQLYKHLNLSGILGWVFENQLYQRHGATITLNTDLRMFGAIDNPIDMDELYMAFQPLKPLSDDSYEKEASVAKIMILLLYDKNSIKAAEFLISNTWGELFLYTIDFTKKVQREEQYNLIARLILKYSDQDSKFFIYQFSHTRDPKIVYQVKKAYNDLINLENDEMIIKKKPYLDKL